MKKSGVEGELHERPWVNFGHNRNEALELAKEKGDYILFIDADEFLRFDPNFKLPHLDKDYYYIVFDYAKTSFSRIMLICTHLPWKWIGVLHEVLCPPASASYATLEGVTDVYTTDGDRSKDPEKFQKDARLLEDALKEEPGNTRYVFYLARSYSDAGDYENALKNYEKRVEMGGWDQEIFYSLFQIGAMQELLKMPMETVIASYNRAYRFRKSRVEPLYRIASLYRINGDYKKGYDVTKIAKSIPVSKDLLFVQQWVYDYGLPLEESVCAYWIEKYDECRKISLDLLKKEDLPTNFRECIERNLEFANEKLIEKISAPLLLKSPALSN